MKYIITYLFLGSLVFCCATQQHARAIARINFEIEEFNRDPYVIIPIKQRVVRIKLSAFCGRAICFDKNGEIILELNRQSDGRFKGQLDSEGIDLDDEGGSWGIIKYIYLEKEMF